MINPIRSRLRFLICLTLFVLSACGAKPLNVKPSKTSTSAVTASMTPFQPEISGTPQLTPSASGTEGTLTLTPAAPTLTGTPSRLFATLQIQPSSTKIPGPADVLAQPDGQVNILVLGYNPPPKGPFSTDIIILLTLRPDNTVHLTSFPRDLYVYIPGWCMGRISAAQAHGGFDLTGQTFDYNFGFKPDLYIMTDLKGFYAIIDIMGGINVHVASTFHAPRPGYPSGYTVQAGTVHMDSDTAYWYTSVLTAAGETDRMRRSQEVLYGMGQGLLSMNALLRVPELYDQFRKSVTTTLGLSDALNILPRLQKADPNKVTRYAIATGQVTPWVEPGSKEHYLLPIPDAIRRLLQEAIGIP
jgi:LCP family protein required for cell wall assembly